ncbi:nucleolar protein 58-like [Polyergus mexicanus]|uniref:nucleolar protein 58-like n=1 Tax=Polyergus mexicanus TaxID=615972 RepID=UPI0038B52C7F
MLNITKEEIEEGEEPLFPQREIVEVLMSDEVESDAEKRETKDTDRKERGERTKENMIERIVEEEEDKNIAMLNLHGSFFGAKPEQKYALSLTNARSGSKKTYYMPDKRLKTLTDTIANKYLKTERKPDIIVTDKQGQFRNAKWRIFCNRMGMRARTLNPTTNPTMNVTRNPRKREIQVIDLQEEEENIIEENRKIQDIRKQLATIQMRKQKDTEAIPSPMQMRQRAKEEERRRNPEEIDSGDCEEEVELRRGKSVDSVAKKPEKRKEIHKESRSNQRKEKESRKKSIHILNQSIQGEKEENDDSPTMTPKNLKNKETRRRSTMGEHKDGKILTNPQPRRGSEPAKSMKRSIGQSSGAETGDESKKEPVKKKRIN